MSTVNLRTQILEGHLTCSICCEEFKNPKALPCLHTFCEGCLRDYVAGRGYESSGSFPCPVCRNTTALPSSGVTDFPNNHLMASLSHTMDSARPVPKPRKSIGQSLSLNQEIASESDIDNNSTDFTKPNKLDVEECVDAMNDSNMSLPPPYSSVSDTNPAAVPRTSGQAKVCSNDDDPNSWMVVAKDEPVVMPGTSPSTSDFCVVNPTPIQPNNPHFGNNCSPSPNPHQFGNSYNSNANSNSGVVPPVAGWNINPLDQNNQNMQPPQKPPRVQGPPQPQVFDPPVNQYPYPSNMPNVGPSFPSHPQEGPLYPAMPPYGDMSTACTENLMLRFGKQGSSVRDFVKPVGLAVSKEGHYVVSDNGGEQNKIFIFNSGGELTAAFKTGYKVEDVSMTQDDDIFAAVQSNTCAFRHFTLRGQLKAELGKFFAYETTCGIAVLNTGGAVLTGPQSNCVYILTDQMKLATKFGRKGNGDGYFLSPSYVAVDSKNHIIVTDQVNNSVQIFNSEGKFKHRFNSTKSGDLSSPLGVCVDNKDNIIVADSGNGRVEVFSPRGAWLSTVVRGTFELGENVKPVNVAVTPTGKVAVLLRGPYFAEVRVYTSYHQQIYQDNGPSPVMMIKNCW